MKNAVTLLTLLTVLTVGEVWGGVPTKRFDVDFAKSGVQWTLDVKAGENPYVMANLWDGTNAWNATGYVGVLRWSVGAKSEAMVTVTGTVSGASVTWAMASNAFPKAISEGYGAVVMQSNGVTVSYGEGRVIVRAGPEISSAVGLPLTYSLRGDLYGPFLGSFARWPFVEKDVTVTNAVGAVIVQGTNGVAGVVPGVAGRVLTSAGSGVFPTWEVVSDPAVTGLQTVVGTLQTSNDTQQTTIGTLQTTNTTLVGLTNGVYYRDGRWALTGPLPGGNQSADDFLNVKAGYLYATNGSFFVGTNQRDYIAYGSTAKQWDFIGDADYARLRIAAGTQSQQAVTVAQLNNSNALSGVASNWSYHVARSNVVLGANWLSGDGGNEGVAVRADGNVGIGTTNPATKLHVENAASGGMSDIRVSSTGAGDSRARISAFGSNNFAGVTIDSFSGTFGGTYAGVPLAGLSRIYADGANGLMCSTVGGKPIVFTLSDAERFRIVDNGNVGVGLTNPVANLQVTGTVAVATTGGGFGVGIAAPSGAMHINANEGIIRFSSNTTFRGAVGHDNGSYIAASRGDLTILSGAGKSIQLGVNANSSASASILANGNFGIGTTNPATPLDVNGTATIRGALTITNTIAHGNMTFTNAGTYFDDLSFSATDIEIKGATDIVADPIYGTLDFDTDCTTNVATSDYAWFVAQMPHKKKLGSAISPHIHFMQTNEDQTNMWWGQYKWMDIGETNAAFEDLGFSTNMVAYSSTTHQIAEFPAIPGSDTNVSSVLVFRLCRNGANGTGNAKLWDADIHIECDSLGSDTEYVK